MPVISFTRFVVVPQNTVLIDDECQPKLVQMIRSSNWSVKFPNDYFRKPVICVFDASPNELCCLHCVRSMPLAGGVVKVDNDSAFCEA